MFIYDTLLCSLAVNCNVCVLKFSRRDNKIPSYFDGISATINSLPCWLDVDDVESPESNDFAKSFRQFV